MQTWIHESYQQYVCVCLQPLNEDWMKKTWSLPNCVLKKWKKTNIQIWLSKFFLTSWCFTSQSATIPLQCWWRHLQPGVLRTTLLVACFCLFSCAPPIKNNGGRNHKAAILLFYGLLNMYLFHEIMLLPHWRSGWKWTLHNMELSSITSSWDWRCQADDHGWLECVRYLNCHSHMALKYHNDESSSMSWALHFNACMLFATYQWTCCSSHVLFTVIITLVQGPAGCDLHWCQRNLPPLISSASSVSIGSSVTCAREVANTVSASLTRQRFWGKFDLFGVLPQSH